MKSFNLSILFPIFAHSYKYYKVQEIAPDILENDILRRWPEVMRALLKDHTTNRNIFWATDMYEKRRVSIFMHVPTKFDLNN